MCRWGGRRWRGSWQGWGGTGRKGPLWLGESGSIRTRRGGIFRPGGRARRSWVWGGGGRARMGGEVGGGGAEGLDADGHLLLRRGDGEVMKLTAGEVTLHAGRR